MIRTWLEPNPVGRAFFAPFDVVFTQFDVVEPDLLYLSNQIAFARFSSPSAKRSSVGSSASLCRHFSGINSTP